MSNYYFVCVQYMNFQISFYLTRCTNREDPSSCEDVRPIKIRKFCDYLQGDGKPWSEFMKHVTPRLGNCPWKKVRNFFQTKFRRIWFFYLTCCNNKYRGCIYRKIFPHIGPTICRNGDETTIASSIKTNLVSWKS